MQYIIVMSGRFFMAPGYVLTICIFGKTVIFIELILLCYDRYMNTYCHQTQHFIVFVNGYYDTRFGPSRPSSCLDTKTSIHENNKVLDDNIYPYI
jgi:hypothetical protein